MPEEIERKFLLSEPPPGLDPSAYHFIEQGYLSIQDGREIRVRRSGEKCSMTIKDGSGLQRGETELSLTPEQFAKLWPLTEGRRLEKKRHLLPCSGLTLEVDIYEGSLAPLCVAEVEFPSVASSESFLVPPFFGQEITTRPEYSNASLALHGAPMGASGQIGCVPLIRKGQELHIMLVRNSSGQRWIVPKGQTEAHMTAAEVALMEASEEGGAVGTIIPQNRDRCTLEDGRQIQLFALRVSNVLKRWPEDSSRKRTILPWEEAIAMIDDKSLAACVENITRRFLQGI